MTYLIIIGALLALVGIVGSIVPALPGPIFSFVALLLLFFAKGPEAISIFSLTMFGIATALLAVLDYLAPIAGARFFGATKIGLIGALIGTIIGAAVFFPWGIILGPFIGALIGEIVGGKKVTKAIRAGTGTFFGTVATTVFQVMFSIVAAIYFFVKLF